MINGSSIPVRVVIGVLVVSMALYALSLSLPNQDPVSLERVQTVESLKAKIAKQENELAADYVALTQLYLAQNNLSQAMSVVTQGVTKFSNNLDLLRLQSDIQSNY